MSIVDVLIPGIPGLILWLYPQGMFVGSQDKPSEEKLRTLRRMGALLLGASACYLFIIMTGGMTGE